MARMEKRKLDRFQYWQGQMLKSRDFRDIQADTAQHRWWHNRALHNAYGVYKGLGVSVTTDSLAIEIRPGLAYDCFGRELLLQARQTVPLPASSGSTDETVWYLLAHYRELEGSCTGQIPQRCSEQPELSLLETAEFFWKPKASVTLTDGVPIAALRFEGTDFTLLQDFLRPAAQPLATSLVASGSTVPGNTAWEQWVVGEPDAAGGPPRIIGVQTTIDTSAAGFTDIPVYFAWLEGPLWNPQTQQLVPAVLPSIGGESTGSFTFQLWLPPPVQDVILLAPRRPAVHTSAFTPTPATQLIDAGSFSLFAQQQGLYVSWVGCQCLSACRSISRVRVFKPQVKP